MTDHESYHLFTPGPTRVIKPVQEAMGGQLIHHRTDAFREKLRFVAESLQRVIGTKGPVLLLTSSGTGAMEAAVANIAKPGDKVLVTVCGKFGRRWQELAEAYSVETIVVESRWGTPVTPDEVATALEHSGPVQVVFTTHTETSTGVLQDVAGIAAAAKVAGALVVVDAISSLCAQEFDMDGWGIDAVIGGSQKGFGVPPGISMVALSDSAVDRVNQPGFPSYYLSLARALTSAEKWNTAYSPAIPQVLALAQSLDLIQHEGLQNVISRHRANAEAVRNASQALGLKPFTTSPCNAATVVLPPDGRAGDIIRTMELSYGVKIAGGQLHLAGKLCRLGHLGFYHEPDIYTLISALEGTLSELGINPRPGAGMAAALDSFERTRKVSSA